MLRTLLVLWTFFAILASPARGATVSLTYTVTHTDRESSAYATLAFTAAPGEANDVTVTRDEAAGTLRVADRGAPLTPGPNCAAATDGGGAVCSLSSAPAPVGSVLAGIALGDGDDRLALLGIGGDAHGGPGADRLDATAAPGATIDGGDGDDVLLGGSGGDVLVGGPGADAMVGGNGTDMVSYADHVAGVVVRLGATGPGGAPGEGDTVGGDVESAVGGDGDDVLVGTDGPNALAGRGGSDRIEGGGGDDVLDGDAPSEPVTYGMWNAFERRAADADPPAHAPTADVLVGGAGRDLVTAGAGALLDGGADIDVLRPAGAATVHPGPGEDLVLATGGGLTADARDDGAGAGSSGGADLVRCVDARPARLIRLGPGDFSDGCGARVTQARLRPIALLPPRSVPYGDVWLPAGAYLTCSDAARRDCAVRVSVRTTSGRAILAERLRVPPGHRRLLDLRPPRREVRRLTAHAEVAHVACVITGRAGRGTAPRTIRLPCDVMRGDPEVSGASDALWR